jgi:hypothetical protein
MPKLKFSQKLMLTIKEGRGVGENIKLAVYASYDVFCLTGEVFPGVPRGATSFLEKLPVKQCTYEYPEFSKEVRNWCTDVANDLGISFDSFLQALVAQHFELVQPDKRLVGPSPEYKTYMALDENSKYYNTVKMVLRLPTKDCKVIISTKYRGELSKNVRRMMLEEMANDSMQEFPMYLENFQKLVASSNCKSRSSAEIIMNDSLKDIFAIFVVKRGRYTPTEYLSALVMYKLLWRNKLLRRNKNTFL